MVRVPRPLLLVAFAWALVLGACAKRDARIVRVVISYQLCGQGCRSFATTFSQDGSSASPAFEWSGHGGDARKIIAEALHALPLDAIERCSKKEAVTSLDRALVGLHFASGDNAFCTVTASGPIGEASNAERIRAYVRFFGWPIYRATLAPQYRALAAAVDANRVRSLELHRTGCFGSCPVYDARFDLSGSATIVHRERGRTWTVHARVPFEVVRGALKAADIDALLPEYPRIAVDTPGATIVVQVPGHRFAIRGPDATSWDRPMTELVTRLDQIVTDYAPAQNSERRPSRNRVESS